MNEIICNITIKSAFVFQSTFDDIQGGLLFYQYSAPLAQLPTEDCQLPTMDCLLLAAY